MSKLPKRPSPVEITLRISLDDAEQLQLLQNSIERVFNNAIEVGSFAEHVGLSDSMGERGSTLWHDCEALQPLTTKIWGAAQEAVRIERDPATRPIRSTAAELEELGRNIDIWGKRLYSSTPLSGKEIVQIQNLLRRLKRELRK